MVLYVTDGSPSSLEAMETDSSEEQQQATHLSSVAKHHNRAPPENGSIQAKPSHRSAEKVTESR